MRFPHTQGILIPTLRGEWMKQSLAFRPCFALPSRNRRPVVVRSIGSKLPDLPRRVLRAFRVWSSAAIAYPLLEELELAANESRVTLTRYVAEVLESFAASRRLPK